MRNIALFTALAFSLIAGAATTASAQSAGRLSINVSGVRSDSGVVRCGLYASAAGFRQPGRELRGATGRVAGQQATCTFNNVPAGNYAVAVFHAEQNEQQIQYGAFGKPKQGYGFSGNPSSSMGPPSFQAAAFSYPGGSQALPVTLQY